MTKRIFWTSLASMMLVFAACDGDSPTGDAGTEVDADAQLGCPAGTTLCGDTCVDTDQDPQSCGACGVECGAGEACVDGACGILCPSGQTECDGLCADTDTDARHCGACGTTCGAGERCTDGACALSCPTGQTVCDAACADTASDPAHCGACGEACAAGEVCSEGACATSCGAGLTDCGGACVDTENSPSHCGACEAACTAPAGGSALCMAGGCRALCDAPMADCNGDVSSATGDACETALSTDPLHCGACNSACSLTNATSTACDDSTCVVTSCEAGFDDCDGMDANGCESELADDDANCGACGNACGAGDTCTDGECILQVGEACADAFALSPGANIVNWTASSADYFTTPASCSSTALDGPDVVLSYTATTDERVTLAFSKPTGNRWTAVVSTEACGTITSELACMWEYTADTMSGSFLMTAGQTAYVYLRDTTSGSEPLDNPLAVDVTAVDCAGTVPVVLDPPNGGTTTQLSPTFTATFGAPVITTGGTVTIAGDMGTSLSYDLATSPAEVSFTGDGTVMEIDAGVAFPPGESLTLSWTGLQAAVCTTLSAVPAPTWGVGVIVPPCTPGTGGIVGSATTRTVTGGDSLTEYYVVADDNAAGYVYWGGTTALYRMLKAGGPVEDVEAAATLQTAHISYGGLLIDGPNLFTIASDTSATLGHIFRISTDGGATWTVRNYASFPTAPSDDFRGATIHGGRIYLATEEDTSGVPTEIWSVDANVAALPAVARLDISVADESDCNAIARDASFYYLVCDDGGDRLIRVPVAGGAAELITDTTRVNSTNNALHGDDTDGDGVFDVLYTQSYYEESYIICDPATATPFVDLHQRWGDSTNSSNYGLGFDRVNNVLYMIDDLNRDLLTIQ